MKSEVSLTVNEQPISINDFVKKLIDSTIGGILIALEGINEIKRVDLQIDYNDVYVNVNGIEVPVDGFVNNTIRNTVSGMTVSYTHLRAHET